MKRDKQQKEGKIPQIGPSFLHGAGWSSPVARQAHNLKAAGSNPAPATSISIFSLCVLRIQFLSFLFLMHKHEQCLCFNVAFCCPNQAPTKGVKLSFINISAYGVLSHCINTLHLYRNVAYLLPQKNTEQRSKK